MVPSPIQGNAESSTISVQIFSFLEEQKQVAAKVSEVILIEMCLGIDHFAHSCYCNKSSAIQLRVVPR